MKNYGLACTNITRSLGGSWRRSARTCLAVLAIAGLYSTEANAGWSHNRCISQINLLLWYGGCGSKATDQEIANCLRTALANHPECLDEVDQLLATITATRKKQPPSEH